jgi:hypothetical protein
MGYGERTIWSQTLASVAAGAVYVTLVLPQLLAGTPVERIPWIWPMLWTIIGAIVVSIVVNIGWGILAGMRDRENAAASDLRDREIGWFGDRVGQAFIVLGGVGGLLLTMAGAERFWIGNAIYAGFVLSALLGGIARLIAYRRGF